MRTWQPRAQSYRRRLSNSAQSACNDNCELARIGGLDRHGFLLSVERRIAFGGLVRRFERVMCLQPKVARIRG